MPPFAPNLLALPAAPRPSSPRPRSASLVVAASCCSRSPRRRATRRSCHGPRPGADRQDHRRARRAGHRLRAAQQRHRARRREGAGRAGARSRSPTQGVSSAAARSRASSCSTSRSSAPPHFQQQVTYQRALEGEIANTIGQVEGVTGAQVAARAARRTTSSPTSRTPATAAVMLGNAADTLEPGAVRGIAQLVASSRQGPQDRQRHDHRRHRPAAVAARGDGGAGGGGAPTKQAAEARYDRRWRRTLNAMLARTLGPGKAQVQVNADLNVDKTTQRASSTYAKKGVPLHRRPTTREAQGRRRGRRRHRRHRRQHPDLLGRRGRRPAATRTTSTRPSATDYGVDKTVTTTEGRAGRGQQAQRRAAGRQVGARRRRSPQLKQTRRQRRRHRHQRAATRSPSARSRSPSRRGAEGRPGADRRCSATLKCGRPRPRRAAVPVLRHRATCASARARRSPTPAGCARSRSPTPLAELERRRRRRATARPTQRRSPPREPDASLQQLDQLMEREPERVAAAGRASGWRRTSR